MKVCLLVITGFEDCFKKIDDMRREQCKQFNIPVLFLYNGIVPNDYTLKDDERMLPIKEHIPGQFIKFHLGMREIFENGWDFDYVIRCTSGGFVDFNKLPLLLSYMPKERCHAGRFCWNEFGVYMSGPCMIFSKDVAKKFSEMESYDPKVFQASDDVMISKTVRSYADFFDLNFFWTDLHGQTVMPSLESMPPLKESNIIFRVKNYYNHPDKPWFTSELGQAIDVKYWELLCSLTGCGPLPEKFVFFDLFGGLGNQLFQYAASYAVSRANKNATILLKDCNHNPHNTIGHNYVAKLFKEAQECSSIPAIVPHVPHQGDSPFFPWNPAEIKAPCKLSGYYQYYPAIQQFMPELVESLSKALGVGERNQNVFLHIRRGDYVGKSHFHFLQGPDYYHTAYVSLIRNLNTVPSKVLVFSDDIEWCKQQEWLAKIPNTSFYENANELEALAEMARCGGGAIIANSTFSWWGAMLSKSTHVYYPSKWIGMYVHDLFPATWTCI
jgi:hypothetical protein